MIEECNLFAVLDLPQGAFIGTGVKTVVLFFKKGSPTEKIWYYQLNADRSLGKTNPLNEEDLKEFVKKAKNQEEDKNSWTLDIEKINKSTFELTPKNPNNIEELDNRTVQEIILEIENLEVQTTEALNKIKDIL